MRFLVLTSIVVATATAATGAQPDALCQVDDSAADTAGRPSDGTLDRRPGLAPVVAIPATPVALPAAPRRAIVDDPPALNGAPPAAAVLAFAPKTSPPLARWF